MSGVSVVMLGVDEVTAHLTQIAREAPKRAKTRMFTQANRTLTKAIGYTPVATGALRGSGRIWMEGDDIYIGFGGPAAPYAVYVHEILRNVHPVGQAKFLERALMEDAALFAVAAAEALK